MSADASGRDDMMAVSGGKTAVSGDRLRRSGEAGATSVERAVSARPASGFMGPD